MGQGKCFHNREDVEWGGSVGYSSGITPEQSRALAVVCAWSLSEEQLMEMFENASVCCVLSKLSSY